MREEDLIYSLSNLDPEIIENSDPSNVSEHKVTPIRTGMSKVAVAAIAFASVLVLSGGIAWAMNSDAIKDFFFPNSEKEFNEVYTEVGREYDLGDYKMIFEGSAYEKAVEQGYLNFSIWDKEGNPIELDPDMVERSFTYEKMPASLLTAKFIHAYKFKLGEAEGYFVATYHNGIFSFSEDNNLFIKFSRIDGGENGENFYEGKDFQFLILNKEQLEAFYNDIDALNEKELCTFTYDKESDRVIANFDENSLLPEVTDIINKYDPCGVETVSYPAQVIRVDNVKLTIGRTDMLMDFDVKDYDLDDFVLRREDGTEIRFIKNEYVHEDFHSVTWQVENPKMSNTGFGSASSKHSRRKYGCNYGFILGANEKVTIEADGKIYE